MRLTEVLFSDFKDLVVSDNIYMENLLNGRLPYEMIISRKHRISFLYTEFSNVRKEGNSLVISSGVEDFDIPAGNLSSLLLGPGTSITQPALNEITRMGCSVVTVARNCLGAYTSFMSAAPPKTAKYTIIQARVASIPKLRLQKAREMYAIRWNVEKEKIPNTNIRSLMQDEGRRLRNLYTELSDKYEIPFKRETRADSNSVNTSLDILNHMLYGVVNSVVLGMGFSTALGIIHHGNSQSFTFDIADLYKEKVTVPLAFKTYLLPREEQRTLFRKTIQEQDVMKSVIENLVLLFGTVDEEEDDSGLWTKEDIIWNNGMTQDV